MGSFTTHRRGARLPLAAGIASACLLGACGGEGSSARSIDGSRTVSRAGLDLSAPSSTPQRLGLEGGASHGSRAPHGNAPSAPAQRDPSLTFATPSGWKELPPTSMRLANFQVGGDPRAECYLTLLGGDGGGAASNVNRWRAQMSLPAASASEIETLPRETFLGEDAVFVDLRGTWKGMSGTTSATEWRLLGLVLVEPGGSAFLKLTGPDDVLAKEREAFLALARSIHIENGIEENAGDLQTALAAARAGQDPHAGLGLERKKQDAAATSSAGGNAYGIVWDVPTGWQRAPDKPARLVTFHAGGDGALECYVTVLPGDAGGTLANVNRWRGQLGLEPVKASELAGTSSLPMLGDVATYVDFTATSGPQAGTRLLAVALNTPQRSVFVKLMGPSERIAAQRAAFEAFAGSLAEAR